MPDPSSRCLPPALPATGPPRCYPLLLPVLGLALIVGSHLLWSSPEYRQRHLLVASVVALWYGKAILWPRVRGVGWPGILFVTGLAVVQAGSWLGGVRHGETPVAASGLALQGLLGVFGLAIFCVIFMEPRWRRVEKWTVLGVLTLLLAGSFIGYFGFIERYIPMGGHADHFSTLRMALIWPTRMLTSSLGQIAWDHTNYAAYCFALAFILMLESLADQPTARRWYGWLLSGFLCAGVFLTGSRGGWMMIALALPLILIGRSPWFTLKTLGLMAVALGGGFAGLKVKIAMLPPPVTLTPTPVPVPPPVPVPVPVPVPTPPPVPPPVPVPPVIPPPIPTVAVHSTALVERGSSGRTDAYRFLWQELEGTRLVGKGLAATGQPAGPLIHEHSSFMATLRGGGLVGLGGHALLLASAAWAAFCLLRRGQRWPAVLLVAAVSGLLFDRSSVIALTGNYEFVTHWVAVLIPLLLLSPRFQRTSLSAFTEPRP